MIVPDRFPIISEKSNSENNALLVEFYLVIIVE